MTTEPLSDRAVVVAFHKCPLVDAAQSFVTRLSHFRAGLSSRNDFSSGENLSAVVTACLITIDITE